MKTCIKTSVVTGLLFVLLCSGCAGRRMIGKDTFLMAANRPKSSTLQSIDGILAVQPFTVALAFDDKGLVYRIGDNQYESDYYNEYMISPAPMVTEQTRNWLTASKIFTQVLPPVSYVEPTHILEGHIKQFYIDLRDTENPQAVLGMSFFLLEKNKKDRIIRFQRAYLLTQTLENSTAEACLEALNQCLCGVLGSLEKDLASNLVEKLGVEGASKKAP